MSLSILTTCNPNRLRPEMFHAFKARAPLAIFLVTLAIMVFTPRPILESGDSGAIALFLETHANLFYRILYADERIIALANFFMLAPYGPLVIRVFPKFSYRWIVVQGVLISGFIEVAQRFIPGRFSDWRDLLANTFGLFLGLLLLKRYQA